jgi:hypothetical protein
MARAGCELRLNPVGLLDAGDLRGVASLDQAGVGAGTDQGIGEFAAH